MERLLEILSELNIGYKLLTHPPVLTVEEADKYWGDREGMHCKNLFLRDKKGKQHYLVIAQKDKVVSMQMLNELLGNERLSFASERRLDRYLKLVPGAVSPFGIVNDMENHVILLIDRDVKGADIVNFHPNVNTATLSLTFSDLEKFLEWSGNEYRYIEL